MDTVDKICLALFLMGLSVPFCHGLRCYTCTVDFRSDAFSINNTCLFPKDHNELAHCSGASKFCKAVITRVGDVFIMLQRSCSKKCMVACTERGFGIRTKECINCCTKDPACGTADLMKKK